MKVVLYIYFMLWLSGCVKELDLPFPATGPQITLNGILHPDSLISITLTETLPVADTQEFPVITDAVVMLYEDNQLVGGLVFQDSAYTIDHYPKAGNEYRIEAEVAGYPMLRATDMMPYMPVASACYERDSSYYSFDSLYKHFSTGTQITIQDRPAERNYYWLNSVNTYYAYDKPCEYINFEWVCPETDSSLQKETGYYYESFSPIPDKFNSFVDNTSGGVTVYEGYIRIEDITLDGEDIAFDIDTPIRIADSTYNPESESFIAINVMSASQAYDRYLKSSITYFLNNGTGEDEDRPNPFAELTQIYSNVENGTGIFAAYNAVSIRMANYPCK